MKRIKGHPELLCVQDLRKAKWFWVKHVQRQDFAGIFLGTAGDDATKRLQRNLGLFVAEDGLIRCTGRYSNARLPYDAQYPVLLPRNSALTDLIILDFHVVNCHTGVSQTLATLRYSFWVPKGRSQVKKVISSCPVCLKAACRPFKAPIQPALPACRVVRQDPFTTTGLDYIGPLLVRTLSGAQKVWICIFTCGVIRAVHLELVTDLSTEQFLLCLRRFIAQHGKPDLIISDNATQFHAANRFLLRLIQGSQEIVDFSTTRQIEWKFIPELSPWMGGFYERLVAIVKDCLRKSLGKRTATLMELQTVVAEISSIINSRPLTYVDADDLRQTITPNDFLSRRQRADLLVTSPTSDDFNLSDKPTPRELLVDQWKRNRQIVDSFWERWHSEYLLNLRERVDKGSRTRAAAAIKAGAVVLIKDKMPKGQWRLGRIESLVPSSDGQIRSATLVLPNRKRIVRPVKLLCPIEVAGSLNSEEQNEPATASEALERPQRKAANLAKQRIREQLASESEGSSD